MENKKQLINKLIDYYLTGHNLTQEEHNAVTSLSKDLEQCNIDSVVVPKGTLCDLDGKTVMVKFKVTKHIPKIVIEDI